jgi:hypothetical protein
LENWGMPYDYKGLESFYIRKLQILLNEKSIKKQSIGLYFELENNFNRINKQKSYFKFGRKYLIMVERCILKQLLKFGKDGEEDGSTNLIW